MVNQITWSEILNLKEKINRTSRQREIVYENWERIITMISRNINMEMIAKEVGVSERTLWRVLKDLNLSTETIKNAYKEKEEKKKELELKKLEKVKAPPTDFDTFKELEIIKAFEDYAVTRRRIKKDSVKQYIGILYRVCKDLMVHPEQLTKELMESWLDNIIRELGELIRDPSYELLVSRLVTALRVYADFRGFSISHKTVEYKGLWNVYFTLEDRRKLVELAYQIFPKEKADMLTTIMELYFRTGMRAKAITTIYDVSRNSKTVEFWVKEKGKKEIYSWKKKIPIELWDRFSKYYPISEKTLKEIRKMLQKLYAVYFGIDKVKVQLNGKEMSLVEAIKKSTLLGLRIVRFKHSGKRFSKAGKRVEKVIETPKLYEVINKVREIVKERERLVVYAIRHPLHIWRHTSAIAYLEATNYNYEIVSVLCGWVKVNTLERVYGKLEYDRAYEIFTGEFKPKPFTFV